MAKKVEIPEPPAKSGLMEKLTPILLILTIVLAFAVGMLWEKVKNLEKGGSTQQNTQVQPQAATLDIKVVKGLWDKNVIKFGDANRKVLFVEVADPSCPFCHIAGGFDPQIAAAMDPQTNRFKYVSDGGQYQPPIPEIKKLVDAGKASYAWVYFPGHTGGEMGAKALYCAYDLGKFWEVHDLLMSEKGYEIQNGVDANNKTTTGPIVGNDKTKSGLLAGFLKGAVDPAAMKGCLDSGKYDSRLGVEQTLATQSLMDPQQGGTPTFLINATRFNGAYSWTEMKSTVDAALK